MLKEEREKRQGERYGVKKKEKILEGAGSNDKKPRIKPSAAKHLFIYSNNN